MLSYFLNVVAVHPAGQLRYQAPVIPGCDLFPSSDIPPPVLGVPEMPIYQVYPRTDRPDVDDMVNHPDSLDCDMACFFVLTNDLPLLFGRVCRPANRHQRVRDSRRYGAWLQLISDPFVVKVYTGETARDRIMYKDRIVKNLKVHYNYTITRSEDPTVLGLNQGTLPTASIAGAVYMAGIHHCRVSMYGMKWPIPQAEPSIDFLINRYVDAFGDRAVVHDNRFDIASQEKTAEVELFNVSPDQVRHHMYREFNLHPMLNIQDSGSVDFKLEGLPFVDKVKIYPEMVHAILSRIKKQYLDDMPALVKTVQIRAKQLRTLHDALVLMAPDLHALFLKGNRLEVTLLYQSTLTRARTIASRHDLFAIGGLEHRLGGRFFRHQVSVLDLIRGLAAHLVELDQVAARRQDSHIDSSIQAVLTRTRQAAGWSGVNMPHHLRETLITERHAARVHDMQQEEVARPGFQYEGCFEDPPDKQGFIKDFISNVKWRPHRKEGEPVYFMKKNGAMMKKVGIYCTRVEAARWVWDTYHLQGQDWRTLFITI